MYFLKFQLGDYYLVDKLTRAESQVVIDHLRDAIRPNTKKVSKKLGAWDIRNAVLPKEVNSLPQQPLASQPSQQSLIRTLSTKPDEKEILYIAVREEGEGKSCCMVKTKFWTRVNYIYVNLDSQSLWDIILLLVLKEAQLIGKSFDKDEHDAWYHIEGYVEGEGDVEVE
jgi:hypothetical protein